MFKSITIAFWHGRQKDQDAVGLKHNDKHLYSLAKRNYFIDKILDSGYNVMLQNVNSGNELTIWIDKGRFTQT